LNIDGQISIVDPYIDSETRTFKILGIVKNINDKLKPGQMVTVNFNFNNRESFFIQENSVFSQDDISFVYLIKDESIIKKRVLVGPRNNGMIEILDGLNPSDLIVYEGINKVKEGSKVVVK
jgi:RND family efflux transporter MFP subunit